MISCSDEHEVIVTERLANAAILKRFEHLSVHESASCLCIFFLSPLLSLGSSDRSHNEIGLILFFVMQQDIIQLSKFVYIH